MTALARQTNLPGPLGAVLVPAGLTGTDGDLTADMLAHLELQLASARRLLGIVLEQGAAIRRRAVRQVVTGAGQLQAEMDRRELLERERADLLARAAHHMGRPAEQVGFTSMVELMDVESAQIATAANAELRGLLNEISRQHELNRALMGQELAFLNHLLGLAGGTGGYLASGARRSAYGSAPRADAGDGGRVVRPSAPLVRNRVFDLEA